MLESGKFSALGPVRRQGTEKTSGYERACDVKKIGESRTQTNPTPRLIKIKGF